MSLVIILGPTCKKVPRVDRQVMNLSSALNTRDDLEFSMNSRIKDLLKKW